MNEEIILNVETNSPYVIGAVAYVEQLENGAKITIVDKNGTTTATVYDGNDGKSISSITLNDDYTLTILYTDGDTTTTSSIRGATGASGVYYGEEEPIDPVVNVWVDPADGDGSVLKIRDEDDQWTPIESIVGEPAGFGTVTATVDANHGTPAVTVTTSGDDTAKNFAFAFSNLQPAPYDDSELQADFAVLQGQFDTAVAAVTTDTEVTDIRVGADGITDTTAGASVRRQFTDLKSDFNDISERLPSRNLVQMLNTSQSLNGVLITSHSNNKVTLSGTANSGGGRLTRFSEIVTLSAGTYCISVRGSSNVTVELNNYADNSEIKGTTGTATFTLSEETQAFIGFSTTNGRTYNETIYIQIEAGSSATDFEPPVIYTANDSSARDAILSLEDMDERIAKSAYATPVSDWENCYYSNGVYQGTVSTRLATSQNGFIEVSKPSVAIINSGYKMMIMPYSLSDSSFQSSATEWLESRYWTTSPVELSGNYKYKFMIAKANDATISKADSLNFNVHGKSYYDSRLEDELEIIRNHYGDYPTEEDELINKVITDRDANTLTFAVMTDTHNDNESERFKTYKQLLTFIKVNERIGVDFLIHLGDTIDGQSTLDNNRLFLNQYWNKLRNTHLPILYSIGNHETLGVGGLAQWGNDPTAISISENIGAWGKQNKWLNLTFSDDKTSWYFDVDNTRVLGLYSCGYSDSGYSDATLSWLSSTLQGWTGKVLVLTHIPARSTLNYLDSSVYNGAEVEELLNDYNVIGFIHGHTHWDNIFKPTGINFPYYSVCCGLAVKMDVANYGCSEGDPKSWDRTLGTITEYCFDVFNVHLDTGVIKSFRFGAGEDRTYTPN